MSAKSDYSKCTTVAELVEMAKADETKAKAGQDRMAAIEAERRALAEEYREIEARDRGMVMPEWAQYIYSLVSRAPDGGKGNHIAKG